VKICINAGHGNKGVNNSDSNGYDPGAIGATGYKESVETKEIADLVSAKLKFNGVETMVYQDGDLYDVTNKSNAWKSDYFISIHCNSFSDSSANGVETFSLALTGKGRLLAESVHKELVPATGLYDRSLKTANYHVLRGTDCPAILTEIGFISNPTEEALMKDSTWDNKVSSAITKGICNFIGVNYKEQITQTIQSINNNNQGDEFKMEHAVFYFTERDFSVARMICSKLKDCAMYCRNGVNTNIHTDIKYIKHPVFVGGSEYHDNSNTTNCCGEHDYDTFILASNYAKTL